MTDLPERMVEAALDAYSDNEWRTSASAMKAALAAALALAEAEGGAILTVVPGPGDSIIIPPNHDVNPQWINGWYAHHTATLAGKVAL